MGRAQVTRPFKKHLYTYYDIMQYTALEMTCFVVSLLPMFQEN